MSAICPTCNSRLACGCQLTNASNGVRVCTLCKGKYEAALLAKKTPPPTPNTPSNMQVTYNPQKK